MAHSRATAYDLLRRAAVPALRATASLLRSPMVGSRSATVGRTRSCPWRARAGLPAGMAPHSPPRRVSLAQVAHLGRATAASPPSVVTARSSPSSWSSARRISATAPAIVLASTAEQGETAGVGASIWGSMPDPPGLFYDALLAIHSTTGLGWGSTLLLATVMMRLSMLPLSVFSDRNSRKVRKPRALAPLPLQLNDTLSSVQD